MRMLTRGSRHGIPSKEADMARKNKKAAASGQKEYKKRSLAAEVWRNYKKNPSAMIALVLVIVIVFVAIFAQFFYDFKKDIVKQHVKEKFQKPSAEHWFGTDNYGRDVFTRVIYGTKYSLSVGVVAVAISCIVGVTLGLIAGYYGGVIEDVILRFCEVFTGIPSILMGVALMTAFGQSIGVLMLAIGLVYSPMYCRTTRAAVLPVRDQEGGESCRRRRLRHYVQPCSAECSFTDYRSGDDGYCKRNPLRFRPELSGARCSDPNAGMGCHALRRQRIYERLYVPYHFPGPCDHDYCAFFQPDG